MLVNMLRWWGRGSGVGGAAGEQFGKTNTVWRIGNGVGDKLGGSGCNAPENRLEIDLEAPKKRKSPRKTRREQRRTRT